MRSERFNLPERANASYLARMKRPAAEPVTFQMYSVCSPEVEAGAVRVAGGTRGRTRRGTMKGRERRRRRQICFLFIKSNGEQEQSCWWLAAPMTTSQSSCTGACPCAAPSDYAEAERKKLFPSIHLLRGPGDVWSLVICSQPHQFLPAKNCSRPAAQELDWKRGARGWEVWLDW